MHRVLVKNEDYEIDWIHGCQCLLAAIRRLDVGRERLDCFFRELKEARNNMQALSLAMDLRYTGPLPDDLPAWLQDTWYPRITEDGLKRQATVRPKHLAARLQWRGLRVANLIEEEFDRLPVAIHWLGKADFDSMPTRRRIAVGDQ